MIFTILAALGTAVGTYGQVQAGKAAEDAAKEYLPFFFIR